MSVVGQSGERVLLPRVGREDFWKLIHEEYAGEDRQRWKGLAMLALRENGGWPLAVIGEVFGHHRGHVSRILTKVKSELRERFEKSPEWLELDDDAELERCDVTERDWGGDAGFENPNGF